MEHAWVRPDSAVELASARAHPEASMCSRIVLVPAECYITEPGDCKSDELDKAALSQGGISPGQHLDGRHEG